MTTLQKEIDDIFNSVLFPTRFTKTFSNVGPSYPPYNIVRIDEGHMVLEIAVAGFKEDEVSVVVDDGYLKISGKKVEADAHAQYLYKGIGTRAFEKTFTLSKHAKVEEAEYVDGILSIHVIEEIPEEKKPKQIPIKRSEKVFLTED
jgi:molecular chaperone IbpA